MHGGDYRHTGSGPALDSEDNTERILDWGWGHGGLALFLKKTVYK